MAGWLTGSYKLYSGWDWDIITYALGSKLLWLTLPAENLWPVRLGGRRLINSRERVSE